MLKFTWDPIQILPPDTLTNRAMASLGMQLRAFPPQISILLTFRTKRGARYFTTTQTRRFALPLQAAPAVTQPVHRCREASTWPSIHAQRPTPTAPRDHHYFSRKSIDARSPISSFLSSLKISLRQRNSLSVTAARLRNTSLHFSVSLSSSFERNRR